MAVGDYLGGSNIQGVILNTTDGGATWSVQLDGSADNLYSVSTADAYNGTVVGYGMPSSGQQQGVL